jgi:hypothetical protein
MPSRAKSLACAGRSYGPIFRFLRKVQYGYYPLPRGVRQEVVRRSPRRHGPSLNSGGNDSFVANLSSRARHFQLALSFRSSQASSRRASKPQSRNDSQTSQALRLSLVVFALRGFCERISRFWPRYSLPLNTKLSDSNFTAPPPDRERIRSLRKPKSFSMLDRQNQYLSRSRIVNHAKYPHVILRSMNLAASATGNNDGDVNIKSSSRSCISCLHDPARVVLLGDAQIRSRPAPFPALNFSISDYAKHGGNSFVRNHFSG